ncbi:MotA/TolQ/ExbB proton channel family protein [Candidatus Omnitrophota bacterium]
MDFWNIGALQVFFAGGPLMWLILMCSIVSLAIIGEKSWQLNFQIKADAKKLLDSVIEQIKHNKIKAAIGICSNARSPVASILKAGILNLEADRVAIKESMEDASLYEIPRLENHLSILATIGHISPLLGLLGTVTGMVKCFHTIQIKATSVNPVNPGDLAGGIWEALLTTVFGLAVAIFTFLFYNYFVSRVNSHVLDMERSATELVNFVTHYKESRR